MSWGRHGESSFRSGRGRGIGAGAWGRRRRQPGALSAGYDAIATADPTWLSISLDLSSEADQASVSLATVSLEEVPDDAPELRDEALIVRTERPDLPTQPTFQDPITPDDSSSDSSSASNSSSVSISVSDPSADVSLQTSGGGDSGAVSVAPPSAFAEELTEAIEVPMPPPVAVRLADEPLPWPLVIVAPTVVLPGSWPPPRGHMGDSEPSGIGPYPSVAEEIALDHVDEDELDLELELDAPSGDRLVAVRPGGWIDFEDSAIDVVIEDPSVIDSMPGLTGLQAAESVEEPPIRGTLDEMPVVSQVALEVGPEALSDPSIEGLEDLTEDGPPTEVNELDALEAALEALRGPGGSDDLSLEMDDIVPDDEPGGATSTMEDLLSLEFDGESEQPVDPDVVADLSAIGLPSAGARSADALVAPGPGIFIEVGPPSPAVVFSIQPAVWLETLDPQSSRPIEVTSRPAQGPVADEQNADQHEADDTPTAPARLPLPREEPSVTRIDEPGSEPDADVLSSVELDPVELDPVELDSVELDSVELEPESDDDLDDDDDDGETELELEPVDDDDEVQHEADEDTLRVARPAAAAGPDVDDSIDFVLMEGEGPATLTLEGDSVNELGPLMVDAEAGAIRVDLALGAPVPERDEATRGVAVAPPQPVRSWEGKTGREQEEHTTDLVALARMRRGADARAPDSAVEHDLTGSDVDRPSPGGDDDWLAEVPDDAPSGESAGGRMSPSYEDTLPGWLPGSDGAGSTRGGPRSARPDALAPLPPEPNTDVGTDD